MRIKIFIVGLVAFFLSMQALADQSEYQVSHETVEKTMAQLVTLLRDVELPEEKDDAYDALVDLLHQNLDPVVDFRRIVARIMGRHFKKASKDQRNAFLDAFRQSLVTSYGKHLLGADLDSIANKLKYEVVPLGKQRREGTSSVKCLLAFEDKNFEIIFSMYYNDKQDKWLVENMIVEGINLGINYRTQFDRMVVSHRGDFDKVIAEWTAPGGEG